ncbi:MAG: thioredoxin family protein [Spirochaetes bacterium]|nr:thioredoxin family protein [Spirochaetota bacterium]
MAPRLGLVLGVLLLGACAASAAKGENGWYSFNEGYAAAVKQGKPMVIDVYTDWCHWCKVMDKDTFAAPAVKKVLDEKFIPIKINAESKSERIKFEGKDLSAAEFAAGAGVDGYPTLLFMDKAGKYVTKVPGFIKAPDFLEMLEFIRLEAYKKQSFDDFLKSR